MFLYPHHIWNEMKSNINRLLALIVEYDPIILFNQIVHFRDISLLGCDKKLMFSKTFKDYRLT